MTSFWDPRFDAKRATIGFVLAAIVWTTSYGRAQSAQDNLCGDPPPVANEVLKGEIEGEAQFISRLVGNASLSGEIENSRTEIFSKYGPDERSDAFFEYMLCTLILTDSEMTSEEKIDKLRVVKREFQTPPTSPSESNNTSIQGDKNVVGSKNVIIGDENRMNVSE